MKSRFSIIPFLLTLSILLPVSPSWSQQEPDEPTTEQPESEALAAPPVYKGDVLYLKTGKVISGVQIIRNTPVFFEIRFQEGMEPLMIPRKHVQRVVFDDIDPARARIRNRLQPPTETVSLASGELVSRYLMEKLRAPVSDTALNYDGVDLVEILQEIAEGLQVNIEVHASVKLRPKNLRLWTLKTNPKTTLMALLRKKLVGQFDYAEVLFENDTIFVMTHEAAKNRKKIKAEEGQ